MTIKRPNTKEQKSLGFELIKGSWRLIPPHGDDVNVVLEKYFSDVYNFHDLDAEDAALARKYNLKMFNVVFEGGERKHAMYSYDARENEENNHIIFNSWNSMLQYWVATETSTNIPKMQDYANKNGISRNNYVFGGKLIEEQLLLNYYRHRDRQNRMHHIPIPLAVDDVSVARKTIVRHLLMHDWRHDFSARAFNSCMIDSMPVRAQDATNVIADLNAILHLITKAHKHLSSYEYNNQVAAYRNYMTNNPEAFNAYLEEINTERLKVNAKALAEVCHQIGNTISELDALKTGLMNMNTGLKTIVNAHSAADQLADRLKAFHHSLRMCNKKFIHTNNALKDFPGIDQ